MGIGLAVILLLVAIGVGWYDRYSVQRTYADVYANRHGHIPPLADWFFTPDADAEVERLRRLHRNLWLASGGLGLVAVVVLLLTVMAQPT
jgi:hypothetical protein